MIPVIFAPSAADFSTNGRGGLSDAISCTVREERNGAYELEMEYPLDGAHFDALETGAVIKAYCGAARQFQPFRVVEISRPINGRVHVLAQHVSYQLSMIPAAPFTANTASAALAGLKSHAAEACPFTFWTDKTGTGTYRQDVPASIRSRLGGVQGSVLDAFGGEYEFDGYTVKLWSKRGQDRHVVLRYGKNLTDLTQEESIANTVTGVYPFWASESGGYVELPEKVLSAASASAYPYPRTVPLDLSQMFQDAPTVTQLRDAAQAYIDGEGIGVPSVSLSVSFANLADTLEYADKTAAEQVELCDTIGVRFERLGVEASAKVIETEWDVLAERYNKLSVGDARKTLAETIAETEVTAAEAVTPSALAADIKRATDLITGVTGGVIRFNYNGDGEPYELYILDTGDVATATSVWRFNASGWGHSSTGWTGPFTLAATLDNGIVADYITAGTLTGLKINNGNGTFAVDETGHVTASAMNITGGSMNIVTGSDTITPLVISGTYTTTTPTYTTDHVYSVAISRQGVTVEDETRTYVTADGPPAYPTTRRVSTYTCDGVSHRYFTGNGSAPPVEANQSAWSSYTGFTAQHTSGDSANIGTIPYEGSSGFYVRRASMVRALVALDENGLRWADSGNNVIGSFGPSDAQKVTALGTLTSASASSVSVANGTWVNLASIAHDAGTYIVTAYYSIASNASGYRVLLLTTSSSGSTPITTQARARVAAANGSETSVLVSTIITATASGAWYMRAYQTSGSSLSVSAAEIRILRIA